MTLRRVWSVAIVMALVGCAGQPARIVPATSPVHSVIPNAPRVEPSPPTASATTPASESAAGNGASAASPTALPSEPAAAPPPPPPMAVLEAMGDAKPKPEARTRRGNPPIYTVLGQTYRLLPTAAGYRERGVASWYGPDFHAKTTSNGEPYDMYGMTAAHRTLPIPVYLRVTNLDNGRSVVVRVNDRGPFKHNRIIDLSYTAAMKLGMLQKGTALVEVEAVLPPGDDGKLPEITAELQAALPPVPRVPKLQALSAGGVLYAQVGAFGVEENALAMERRLREGGIDDVVVLKVRAAGRPLWRVRVGPITSVEQYDAIVDQLERAGIREVSLANAERPNPPGSEAAD